MFWVVHVNGRFEYFLEQDTVLLKHIEWYGKSSFQSIDFFTETFVYVCHIDPFFYFIEKLLEAKTKKLG